jgi:DGQHR domain-containing protein
MIALREAFPEQQYASTKEAQEAASEAASMSGDGRWLPGILYFQGPRRFICTSIRGGLLVKLIKQIKAPPRKDLAHYDVEHERNRPLDDPHKRVIRDYLTNINDYILPPILLNSRKPLQIFTVKSTSPTIPCFFVLPDGDYLDVTDGQHRIEGLREAIHTRQDLAEDGVAISLVEEPTLSKSHQDFYDAAQVKPIQPAQLVEYDQRETLNWLTRELVKTARIFADRVQRLGTKVSPKSPFLFTNSMVKRALVAMLSGDPDAEETAGFAAEGARDIWYERIHEFLEVFTEHNPQWAEIAHRSLASGQTSEVPMLRNVCMHTVGAGLLVIGGVAHGIFAMSPADNAKLTPEQLQYTHRLAHDIDWRRDGANTDLWHRSILNPLTGSIQPHVAPLALAITDVKQAVGLPLTEGDYKRIAKAEAQLAKKRQQEQAKLEEMLARQQEGTPVGV